MKTLVIATITNHGVRVGDASFIYGVPTNYFPHPQIPGCMFKLTMEFIGTDPNIKPELHAFWPSSQFGRLCSTEPEIIKLISECRRSLRSKNPNPGKDWWKKRCEKLEMDLRNVGKARREFAVALRLWKKHLVHD